MRKQETLLPDGSRFTFWDDTTAYPIVYHVAQNHPSADDENQGAIEQPWKTIGRAARALQPGEKVIVHQGIYRECVVPARGGEGPDRMIAYEAADGEDVTISGGELWHPVFQRCETTTVGAPVLWMADLPEDFFIGYNPFLAANTCRAFGTYGFDWTLEERQRLLLRRGMVFVNGRPLRQVFSRPTLMKTDGTFWAEEPGLRIHFRLWDDADPHTAQFEVTTREQAFAPRLPHMGYIRVKGFQFEYAADGVPFPQRAMVSANWGHHWIIEDNRIRWANACGLDAGWAGYLFHERPEHPSGRHIIRRNMVSDCGVCGIAAVGGNDETLVEDNVVERIGGLVPERVWESAGLKFHFSNRVLIRRNVFRHIREASGLWMDVDARICRISENVFADIETAKGAIQMECCCHAPNLIAGNVFWNVRKAYPNDKPAEDPWGGGFGIYADCNDFLITADNLFVRIVSYAVYMNLCQSGRFIHSRVGMCRHNKVLNNIFAECPHAILFGRREDNISDGNLFGRVPGHADAKSRPPGELCVQFPEPKILLDPEGWRDYTGQDSGSAEAAVTVEFDPERLELSWQIPGKVVQVAPASFLPTMPAPDNPGPFKTEQWRAGLAGGKACHRFVLQKGWL